MRTLSPGDSISSDPERLLQADGERIQDKKKFLNGWGKGREGSLSIKGNGTPTPVLLPGKSHIERRETSLSLFTFMHWRRKWQPTRVFLPEESQGWGSLVGCRLWGHTESVTTEAT